MKHQIKVISDFPVDTDITIGSVFYAVEQVEADSFTGRCPICDGEGKISVRGTTFTCPECFGRTPLQFFYGYAVRAFRVYAIESREEMRGYALERHQLLHLVDSDYYGKDMTPANKRIIRPYQLNVERDLLRSDVDQVVFSNYARAVAFADKIRAAECEHMERFNAKYGTNYKLEWRINDVQPPEDDGKCWGNGDCQDCPKAKYSSSSLFTEEPRVIGCAEDDGR